MPKKSPREQEVRLSIRDLKNLKQFYVRRAEQFGVSAREEASDSRRQWLLDRQAEYKATAETYDGLIQAAEDEAKRLAGEAQSG